MIEAQLGFGVVRFIRTLFGVLGSQFKQHQMVFGVLVEEFSVRAPPLVSWKEYLGKCDNSPVKRGRNRALT